MVENPATWGPVERAIAAKWDEWSSDMSPGYSIVRMMADLFRTDEMQKLLHAEAEQRRIAWEEKTKDARHKQMLIDGGGA